MGMRGIVSVWSCSLQIANSINQAGAEWWETASCFVTAPSRARRRVHPRATSTPCKLLIFLPIPSVACVQGGANVTQVTWFDGPIERFFYSGRVSRGWAAFSKNSLCSLRLSWSALTARVAFTIPSIQAFILNCPNSRVASEPSPE